jgi:GNAT superfamily N-acetyltransferase
MKLEYYENGVYGYRQIDAIGDGYVSSLSGNAAIGVSHGVWINDKYRGKGIGKQQHKQRLDLLRQDGCYTHLLCTVNNHNVPEVKILSAFGWVRVYDLGEASIWIKDLATPDEPINLQIEDVQA